MLGQENYIFNKNNVLAIQSAGCQCKKTTGIAPYVRCLIEWPHKI